MAVIMKTGGGGGKPNVLTVSIDTGATVTATGNGKVVSGVSVDGKAVLKLPKPGVWSIFAELDGQTTEDVITISDDYPIEVPFGLPLNKLAVGSLVQVIEGGSAVNYRVVHQGLPSGMYEASCDGTWVLREDIHSTRAWSSSNKDYANSDIHAYLNSTFLGMFDNETQANIKQIKIPYKTGTSGNNIASGASGLSAKIFLLGCYELAWTTSNSGSIPADGACLDYFKGCAATDSRRIGKYNGSNTIWWLRSALTSTSSAVWVVDGNGASTYDNITKSWGIRPAMVLDGLAVPEPNADGSYTLMV